MEERNARSNIKKRITEKNGKMRKEKATTVSRKKKNIRSYMGDNTIS